MVTDKQWKVIRWIEQNLGIEFKGQWKEQATVFIEMHIEESKYISSIVREQNRLTRDLYNTFAEDEEMDDDRYFGETIWQYF